MKVTVEFDSEEFRNFRERLYEAVDKAVARAAEKVRSEAIENLDRNKTNNTGDLRKSIITSKEGWAKYKVLVGELYGVFVEYGTKPHFPPPSEIEKWVVRKLGVKGKEAKKLAWAISKHIAIHGTKEQPFWRPAVKKARSFLVEEVERVVKEMR